jgi:two-component system cell cycle sensor histidine kinase/response regulator CckA
MNIALTDLDGFTTAHALHKIDPSVKIIAFSGLKTKILSTMAAKIGLSDFLFKPFSAHELLRVTANVLHEAVPQT